MATAAVRLHKTNTWHRVSGCPPPALGHLSASPEALRPTPAPLGAMERRAVWTARATCWAPGKWPPHAPAPTPTPAWHLGARLEGIFQRMMSAVQRRHARFTPARRSGFPSWVCYYVLGQFFPRPVLQFPRGESSRIYMEELWRALPGTGLELTAHRPPSGPPCCIHPPTRRPRRGRAAEHGARLGLAASAPSSARGLRRRGARRESARGSIAALVPAWVSGVAEGVLVTWTPDEL